MHAIYASFFTALIGLPILFLLSHVPIIWPEMLGSFVAVLCVCIGINPYRDYFRALASLIAAYFLLHYKVTFDATIFEFHVEKYLYYIVIAVSLLSLWRRFYNWLCWKAIDRICCKYCIPHYDQKTLMDEYEGFDTHYGENRVAFNSYQKAVEASQQRKEKSQSYIKN